MASDWLVLQLPANAGSPPAWTVVDSAGALVPLPEAVLDDPVAAAAGRQVALLAPAGDVALFQVALPAANEARLLQLAPFALEEQVSRDLDELHFAVGVRDSHTGLVPVAVVDRARVADWLAQAASLGVRPRAVFAESDLVPALPGHVTMLVTGDEVLVRHGPGRAVPFPADDIELALATVLGPDADLAVVDVVVHATSLDWARHQARFERLRERVASLRVQLSGSGLLVLYAQGIAHGAPINLLQGSFKPQTATGVTWRRWRVAAALLAGLLVLQAGASLWELRRLRQAAAELDATIARVYGTIFPGQQPGPNLRRTLETRMRAAAGGGSPSGDLMPLLAALAAARQNVPVARLDAISYKPGGLQMRLTAPDAATLEQFSQAMRAGGLGAQVTNGTPREGGFEGQIEVTTSGT